MLSAMAKGMFFQLCQPTFHMKADLITALSTKTAAGITPVGGFCMMG